MSRYTIQVFLEKNGLTLKAPITTIVLGAVWSGSTLFAYMQNVSLKSWQEDAADDISRRHFQMQFFLVL